MISSRSSRSVRLVAGPFLGVAAMLACLATLSACSAGQITQTSSQVSAIGGANKTSPDGSIALRDVQIPYNDVAGYPKGGVAPLVVRVFNDGNQAVKLVRVTASGAAERVVLVVGPPPSPTTSPSAETTASPAQSASPGASPTAAPTSAPAGPSGQDTFALEIAPSSYLLLVPGQGQYLQLVNLAQALAPGTSVPLTFTFDNGITVEMTIPVGLPTAPVPRVTPEVHEEE